MVESDKPVLFRKIAAGEFSSRLLVARKRHGTPLAHTGLIIHGRVDGNH